MSERDLVYTIHHTNLVCVLKADSHSSCALPSLSSFGRHIDVREKAEDVSLLSLDRYAFTIRNAQRIYMCVRLCVYKSECVSIHFQYIFLQ